MKILVLVKQVPADLGAVKLNEDHTLDRTAAGVQLNPVDKNAIEAAVQITEQLGGEVTVLTLGPATVRAVLKEAVSVGAHRGVAVTDDVFAGSDAWATARVLAAAARHLGSVDLVLAGKQSFDGGTGEVPAMVAELLDLPQVTGVTALTAAADSLVCTQVQDGGQAQVRVSLPAVVTVDEYVNTPRYPSVKSKLAANKATFDVLTNAELGVPDVGLAASVTTIVSATRPPARQPGVRIEGDTPAQVAENLVAALVAAHVL
ncbi:MAG: electron transfer flavoprotein subunit beta/FixA family protein [Actinobacteria bacterium]|nr:electron transfer flavoprotein subunit beta/FixA family protein [Actinomycetota bacterium]MCG2801901.1 electron transfer flavoprotein subunit beta/FixA family protein [Cellulomonas sp.]